MNNNEKSLQQNRQHESALACFCAAFELHKQQQKVNSNTILQHLGKGSRSTTSKYARLWHRLTNEETDEVPPEVLKAYEAAREGSDTTDTAPHDPAPPLYTEFVEQVIQQVARQLTETGWLVTQKLIDQEIETVCLDAEQQVAVAEEARKNTETALKKSASELSALKSRLEAANSENATLQHDLGKLQERLNGLELQKQEWKDKSSQLEQASREQLLKLARLETKLDNAQQQVQHLRQTNERLEARLHEQSTTIATLTGQARAAEARVVSLENLIVEKKQ